MSRFYWLILIILALVFSLVCGSVYFSLTPAKMGNDMWIFNTPDETANYFFIEKFSQENTLQVLEPLNEISGSLNLVHPRGATVIDNHLVAGSFLGFIILLRLFAKIFSLDFVPFVIPLVSFFAILSFYWLLKNFFSAKVAFFSALALMAMPAFWYYNSRSLFNNVLFIDLAIIGFAFLLNFSKKNNLINLALAGLLLGLALTIRTSDIFLVGLLVIVFFVCCRKQIKWRHWLFFFAIAFLAFAPVFGYQYHLYGNPFLTGYTPELADKINSQGGSLGGALLKQIFLPFGFNFFNILKTVYYYFGQMFWWYFIPTFLGAWLLLVLWLKKRLTNPEKIYFLSFILVSLVVTFYYGSWWFYNNLMARPLIGSSQVRYLLPVYVMGAPLLVYFLVWLLDRLKNKKIRVLAALVLMALIGFFSVRLVFFQTEESLLKIKATVKEYHQINKKVRSLTEEYSVIVSSYQDKVFFPKRKVIFYWQEKRFLKNIEELMKAAPIYFYSIDSEKDLAFIGANSAIKCQLVTEFARGEKLYKFYFE